MSASGGIRVGVLKRGEVDEAGRILRLAFGTYLGIPNPLEFMGDRDLLTPRWRSEHVKVLAARQDGRLVGSNAVTRWGSFGFFGPLTVLPEYWNKGVAHRLLEATVKTFDEWGVRRSGLFTFSSSAKHVTLYQKFGYWPQYLTAVMERVVDMDASALGIGLGSGAAPLLLSAFGHSEREKVLDECAKLTGKIDEGLDLGGEIGTVLAHKTGDVVLTRKRGGSGGRLDGFAICLTGAGSEGGGKVCYVKFGAVRGGAGAAERFDGLLGACETFAAAKGVIVEAGVNLAREGAFRRMRARGYRVTTLGVALQRPHVDGFNRADAYVIDDWR